MDIFKRNKIQLSDFKRLIFDDLISGKNFVLSGGKEVYDKPAFDWKVHARQQLGLYLSRKFANSNESFEKIAQHNIKMTYTHFLTWIESSQALTGFNLTDRLNQ